MASTILSDNGVSSGSAGLKSSADSTGALALQTTTAGGAATTAMTIDTSQNVGIGTTSPQAKLHVGTLNGTGSLNGYTKLAVEATDYAVTTLKAPAANFSQIIFTDTTTTSLGGINYFNSSNSTPNAMAFVTNGSERARIDSSGVITSGLGGMQVISGTAVALSGTAVGFTGIPSWVKRITLMFYNGVSSNGTSVFQIQIGSGSYTTSGYTGAYGQFVNASASSWAAISTGFGIFNNNAPDTINGSMVLTLATGNTWVIAGMTIATNRGIMNNTTGYVALGGALDRIRLTTVNGTDSFDAGSINILYE